MLAANSSTISQNFEYYCDQVSDNYETVIVTRDCENHVSSVSTEPLSNVVLISLEEYTSLLKSVKRAEYMEKIHLSQQQLAEGKVVVKTIEELEAMENE